MALAPAAMALVAAALVGCDASRVTQPSMAEGPSAVVFTTPEIIQTIPWEQYDPCTLETVQGTLQARYSADFDDVTGHITFHAKFNFSGNGLQIIGHDLLGNPITQLTNTQYSGSGEDNEETNDNFLASKFEMTTVTDMRIFATNALTGESMDDFLMHVGTHFTMFLTPPPPTLSAQTQNIFVDCK